MTKAVALVISYCGILVRTEHLLNILEKVLTFLVLIIEGIAVSLLQLLNIWLNVVQYEASIEPTPVAFIVVSLVQPLNIALAVDIFPLFIIFRVTVVSLEHPLNILVVDIGVADGKTPIGIDADVSDVQFLNIY